MIGGEESLDLSDDEEDDVNGLDEVEAAEPEDEPMAEDSKKERVDEEEEDDDDEDDDEEEDDYMLSEDEDEDDDDEEEDEEMNDDNSQVVTMELLSSWTESAKKKSTEAFKELLIAFRSIARSDEETDMEFKYKVNSHKGEYYQILFYLSLENIYK